MRIYTAILTAAFMLAFTTPATQADQYELTGTLRDFSSSHPDFQNSYNWQFPLIRGMVKDDLGPDGKPQLNVGTGIVSASGAGCYAIECTSLKDLSNVVIKLEYPDTYTGLDAGLIVEHKFDNLNEGGFGHFEVPEPYLSDGMLITAAWVKAGRNASGDGAGYGELFTLDAETSTFQLEEEAYTVINSESTITTQFFSSTIDSEGEGSVVIPGQWRVQSIESFNNWFNNYSGINESIPISIVLDNGQIAPGGIYRFEASIHNNKMFFPADGKQLKGNEGNSHNYHFTYEIATKFVYTDPSERAESLVLNFSGDDDVWLFINGKLVIDLGGVHGEQTQNVNIDAIASDLGLSVGGLYDFNFFFAERHTTHSNLTLETNLPFLASQYD